MKPRKNEKIAICPHDYWSKHTVHLPKMFPQTAEDDIAYFQWRCDQYPGYLDLMPVSGHDNLDVLDYGCGPGHDLIGIATYSNPRSLTGVDVSKKAIDIANQRLELHSFTSEVKVQLLNEQYEIPLNSFDYIHSSGVLHHVENLVEILKILKDSLRDDGRIRIMVYNKDSIWWNLYVPYVLQIKERIIHTSVPISEAFRMSTDGLDCPISNAYTLESFKSFAIEAGLKTRLIGSSISLTEINVWEKFHGKALLDSRLHANHVEFLSGIKTNKHGELEYKGIAPGINLVLELIKF